MRTLDRYVFSNFLLPLIYCFLGFLAVWLVIDLSNYGPDFIAAKTPPLLVAGFYLFQLPAITIAILPIALLLAVLYSLGKMSRSNEIISMLTAGISLPRILLPLLISGVAVALLSTLLNYELGPQALSQKQEQLEQLTNGKDKTSFIEAHLFRNRKENRTWYASRVELRNNMLRGVQIIQQDALGNVLLKYYVRNAEYVPATHSWSLDRGAVMKFDAAGTVLSFDFLQGNTMITGWDETPWRITSSSLKAPMLSVPQLREYLANNNDFPQTQLAPFHTHLLYRWALPWNCLIAVLIAAPLGIAFSRRGVLGGVATSIFIFAGMQFAGQLFVAFGAGDRLAPVLAVWLPILFFGLGGSTLLVLRSANRDLSSLNPFRFFFKHAAKKS